VILTACERQTDLNEPGTAAFAEAFRKANKADSTSPMLDLYHLDGVEERTVRMLELAIEYELRLPIESIEFAPLSGAPEESIDFTHNGIAYGPSIEPQLRMRVVYAMEDKFTSLFTLGQLPDGQLCIVCAKPKANTNLSTALTPR
jgi:hypothetical protein